ncbi:TetR/AcrR family transcriptional regulator [Amycolatopsis sp. 195334CR]|uniref:TetR/AcrR family transcriptional regulator n=1 Tax=Amycolatopsis sp. 195334CR TaxID=2814588 RepID=UPI001A8CFFF3|nr:TetR/AcrR family transcriptional regulator [Amycolatopsis sp. 195334CR]MBN6036604.1 TetR/AcrR family transcriptional regulator [Amycolatopsis sp. 195334CR]
MDGKRQRANAGDGEKLREEILEAAEALLIEAGTEEALTLRAVARQVGVTTPSVYLHFAGKSALLEAVCLRVWHELAARMHDHASGVDDPLRALGRCGRVYANFALDHPVQYRVLMMRPTSGLSPGADACFRHIVQAVAACVDAGIMRGAPESLAVGLWSALHGCVTLLIAHPEFAWPADRDALIDGTIRMAGFGSVLASRIPREATPSSEALSAGLDALTKEWRGH